MQDLVLYPGNSCRYTIVLTFVLALTAFFSIFYIVPILDDWTVVCKRCVSTLLRTTIHLNMAGLAHPTVVVLDVRDSIVECTSTL
jgi:hypothetical protein